MIFLLPLIVLAAANSCPYCRWDQCTLTEGSFGSCGECYSMAARLSMEVPSSDPNGIVQKVGICQLCPDHCNSCEQAQLSSAMASPRMAINCTDCQYGYMNSFFNGSCLACPDNCAKCSCSFNTCSLVSCDVCEEGYEAYRDNQKLMTLCQPSTRRLQESLNH